MEKLLFLQLMGERSLLTGNYLLQKSEGAAECVTYGPRASRSCDWQVTLSGFLTKACHS